MSVACVGAERGGACEQSERQTGGAERCEARNRFFGKAHSKLPKRTGITLARPCGEKAAQPCRMIGRMAQRFTSLRGVQAPSKSARSRPGGACSSAWLEPAA